MLKLIEKICTWTRQLNLCHAIKRNNVRKVRRILAKDPDIYLRWRQWDCTLLWEAVDFKNEEILELLIDVGADVNEEALLKDKAHYGRLTFFHFLAELKDGLLQSYEKSAEVLIKRGANINVCVEVWESEFRTPLQMAIERGNVQFAEFLLKKGVSLIGDEWSQYNPVYFVLRAPRGKVVEMLQLLIQYGLDTGFRDKYGQDYLHYSLSTASLFPDRNIDVLELAKIFLDNGLAINDLDNFSQTVLIKAAYLENLELVSFLIDRGVDVNLKSDIKGLFPLYLATDRNNEKIVDLLLQSGANINAENEDGCTPLHRACYKGHERIINLLIQRGVDVNVENSEGLTPFFYLVAENEDDSHFPGMILMIREMAKRKFSNLPVSSKNMDLIEARPELSQLFKSCMKELNQLSRTKFHTSYSYYFVMKMSKNVKTLAGLTRNVKFVKKFEDNLTEFSHYSDELQRIFNEAVEIRNNSQAVISRLSAMFGSHFPELVIKTIARNLTVDDLPLQ